ncbi:MAG: phage holin family protein [Peptostreptococcaceae bacterium]|nr:phage holin family protein [Peptostreptococcaceae bacterium]
MNKFINRWLGNAISIYVIAWLFEGVYIRGFFAAMVAALVLGMLNMLVRPVLIVLTLPINIMTLGIFTFILNGFLLKVVDFFVAGFGVDSFMTAVFASIVLTFVNMIITSLTRPKRERW